MSTNHFCVSFLSICNRWSARGDMVRAGGQSSRPTEPARPWAGAVGAAADLVAGTHMGLLSAPLGDAPATRTPHDHEKVHAIDASARIVLEAKVDVLRDAKPKVAGVAEVALPQFVLLHLETALKKLLRLLAAHGDVARDLLIPPNAESPHGVASCRSHNDRH